MNRKGFTLVEILAVIVIMGIVLVIAIPNSIDSYKKSKLKTEEVFTKRLSQVIDEYVTLNIDTLNFSKYKNGTYFSKPTQDELVTVYYKNITVNDLIDQKLLSSSNYVNPNNKNTSCSKSAQIELYRDSDFVYCHKIKASSLGCITSDYTNEYLNGNSNNYIIDTCVWEETE